MMLNNNEKEITPASLFDQMIKGLETKVDGLMFRGEFSRVELKRSLMNIFNHVIRERSKSLPFQLTKLDLNGDIDHIKFDEVEQNYFLYD